MNIESNINPPTISRSQCPLFLAPISRDLGRSRHQVAAGVQGGGARSGKRTGDSVRFMIPEAVPRSVDKPEVYAFGIQVWDFLK